MVISSTYLFCIATSIEVHIEDSIEGGNEDPKSSDAHYHETHTLALVMWFCESH